MKEIWIIFQIFAKLVKSHASKNKSFLVESLNLIIITE